MLIGICGKPSTGKSTFFKALTLANVDIANYPFTTVKPNSAVAYVKVDCVDKEFGKQCNPRVGYCLEHKRFIAVDVIDVAGLVPGAHEGLGLGNQFLNDLNPAHALIHVIDVSGSTNEKGEPVKPGSYDPANDVNFLDHELDMWYLRILKDGWEKFARTVMQTRVEAFKPIAKQMSGVRVDEDIAKSSMDKLGLLNKEIMRWTDDDLLALASELRKRTKPMIIAANKIDIPGAKDNFDRLVKEFPDKVLVPCSAESELALKEASKHGLIKYVPGEDGFEVIGNLNEQQAKALEFIRDNVLQVLNSTGVQYTINKAVFDILKYIAIFPGGVNKLEDSNGNVLPDCFLLPQGSTALDFAYKLHTDLGKGFIRAIDVKTKKTVGKDHVLKHRDVVEIISSN